MEMLVLEGQKGMDGLSDGRDVCLKLTSDRKNDDQLPGLLNVAILLL